MDAGHPKTQVATGSAGDDVAGAAIAALALAPALAGHGGAAAPEWAPVFGPSRLRPLLGCAASLRDLAVEAGCAAAGWGRGLALS